MRARWMDPGTGRFVSVDPFDGDKQTPISLHRYLYANASPVSMRDPNGKFTLGMEMAAIGISNILANNVIPSIAGTNPSVIAMYLSVDGWDNYDFQVPVLQCKFNFTLKILGKKEDCVIIQKKKGVEVGGVSPQSYNDFVDDPAGGGVWWDGNNWNNGILSYGEWKDNRTATWSDRPGVYLASFPVYKDMEYKTIVKNKRTGVELRELRWGIHIDITSANDAEFYFTY